MTTTRNSTLDVIRALLAWLIVLLHCFYISGINTPAWHQIGVWTVAAFVTLSGYVITELILVKKESYKLFVFRRFMRLFPLFLMAMLFALALRPVILGSVPIEVPREAAEHQHFWFYLGAHLPMLHGLNPAFDHFDPVPLLEYTFLPPAWSVSLEWQCYLAAPFLVWLMVRGGPCLIGSLLVITSALALAQISDRLGGSQAFLPFRIAFFILGATLAIYRHHLPRLPAPRWPYWLVQMGQRSYSTYLIHFPLLMLMNRARPAEHDDISWALYLFFCGTPAILWCSWGLYELIEKPGIELGKAVVSQIRERKLLEAKIASSW